ncbi:unnamed protein product [Adineta steineri]|uniref:RING-type domain-containing protein n=1 Tax=Adineta steineri TaxID=433720 RepID=A0A818UEK3_9BILA|nr:unnamed protein product [Adineta steineri]
MVKKNQTLYRGLELSQTEIESFKNNYLKTPKAQLSFRSFMSCSRNRDVAEKFGSILLIINVIHALTMDLAPFSKYSQEEEEVLLYPEKYEWTQPQSRDYSSTTTEQQSGNILPFKNSSFFKKMLPTKMDELHRAFETCKSLAQKQSVHSTIAMNAAGFYYTGYTDTVCCHTCNLEVSGWTIDMKPFTIHSQRSPACAFVRSIKPEGTSTASSMYNLTSTISTSDDYDEKSSKRQKTDVQQLDFQLNLLIEVNLLKQIRKRTFSHWPLRTSPSSAQMIQAGFFHCNVGDRVICLYCKIVCQQWTSNGDDPWDVHKTLSPKCPYVIAMLKRQQTASIHIVNEQNTRENTAGVTTDDPFRCHEVVYTAACNTDYIEIPRRYATFATWLNENTPSVDDLVRAGFFYSGTKTIVTCFYCNGSLQNWGKNDNPMIEHARWFPNCAYAKQLCGADLYRKIQESKKAQQGLLLFILLEFGLNDDFEDSCDVYVACIILQKQIEYINGKKENLIIPSTAMNEIRMKEQAEILAREQITDTSSSTNSSSSTDVVMTTSTESIASESSVPQPTIVTEEKKDVNTEKRNLPAKNPTNDSSSNVCVLCLEEEKRLACIPCGHLATCVPCVYYQSIIHLYVNIMESSTTTDQYSSNMVQSTTMKCCKQHQSINKNDTFQNLLDKCQQLTKKHGVHSALTMRAAGFHYTGDNDTVLCETCGLQVSQWTLDMKPFTIHLQRSPTCSYVCSLRPIQAASAQSISTSKCDEMPCKRQKIESTQENSCSKVFVELEILKQIRRRTFSHWPHHTSHLKSQLIEAGFFSCNVNDRVICIYCNKICQKWTLDSDNPSEVHKTLSPQCPYVISMLTRSEASSIPIINDKSTNNNSDDKNLIQFDQIVNTSACHSSYREITKRHASFNTWTNENTPSVDDLVNAGFFYTGTKTVVTCFYCNGSLQNWGAKDNPMIEHARWFPHCAYVKQLCGAKLYGKIQAIKQRQKENKEKNDLDKRFETTIGGSYSGQLNIPNDSILSSLVASRLDLPSSRSMFDQNFKLSIVKRCWEDQLRLKRDDFVSDADLFVACTILQKQMQHIDGKKENIIIPSIAMSEINRVVLHEKKTSESIQTDTSNITDTNMSTSIESNASETTAKVSVMDTDKEKDVESDSARNLSTKDKDISSSLSPCALCLTEDRCLACIPCGHVATCVPCGHSLKSCPMCRAEIKAFVRIYL